MNNFTKSVFPDWSIDPLSKNVWINQLSNNSISPSLYVSIYSNLVVNTGHLLSTAAFAPCKCVTSLEIHHHDIAESEPMRRHVYHSRIDRESPTRQSFTKKENLEYELFQLLGRRGWIYFVLKSCTVLWRNQKNSWQFNWCIPHLRIPSRNSWTTLSVAYSAQGSERKFETLERKNLWHTHVLRFFSRCGHPHSKLQNITRIAFQ